MCALDDLGMAARAAQLFAPLEIVEGDLVVQGDLPELDLALEESPIVAARTDTALVLDLRPGLGFHVEARPVAPDHDQTLDLRPDERFHAGRVMTDLALNVLVRRCLPALEEGRHVVAG